MKGRLMIALEGDIVLAEEDDHRLRHPAVGGVILFARNFTDSAQLRRLTAAIRVAAARPLLIAVDQEGGRVQRFRGGGFTDVPSMRDIAARPDASAAAQAAGIVLAAELRAHGIDLTFAPVLDIDHGNSQIIGGRAFSSDPARIAELATQLVAGLQRGGMAACGKHFPGHGYAVADSHHELPTDTRPLTAIRSCDLIPFARCADILPLLMTAHIVYFAADANTATFSPFWLREVLRRELNYAGLIVSDDLSMAGAAIGDMNTRIRAARIAGCDLLMVCAPQQADEAIAAMEDNDSGDGNLWRTLANAGEPRISIGDADYRRAVAMFGASA